MATNTAVIQKCWCLGDTQCHPQHPGDIPLPTGRGLSFPATTPGSHCPHSVPRSDCAILYNDRSVLENHHISAVFRMMQDDEMNIFVNLTKDEFA